MRIRIKKQYLLLALIVLGVVSILGVLAWTLLNNQVDPNQAAAGGNCSSPGDAGNTQTCSYFNGTVTTTITTHKCQFVSGSSSPTWVATGSTCPSSVICNKSQYYDCTTSTGAAGKKQCNSDGTAYGTCVSSTPSGGNTTPGSGGTTTTFCSPNSTTQDGCDQSKCSGGSRVKKCDANGSAYGSCYCASGTEVTGGGGTTENNGGSTNNNTTTVVSGLVCGGLEIYQGNQKIEAANFNNLKVGTAYTFKIIKAGNTSTLINTENRSRVLAVNGHVDTLTCAEWNPVSNPNPDNHIFDSDSGGSLTWTPTAAGNYTFYNGLWGTGTECRSVNCSLNSNTNPKTTITSCINKDACNLKLTVVPVVTNYTCFSCTPTLTDSSTAAETQTFTVPCGTGAAAAYPFASAATVKDCPVQAVVPAPVCGEANTKLYEPSVSSLTLAQLCASGKLEYSYNSSTTASPDGPLNLSGSTMAYKCKNTAGATVDCILKRATCATGQTQTKTIPNGTCTETCSADRLSWGTCTNYTCSTAVSYSCSGSNRVKTYYALENNACVSKTSQETCQYGCTGAAGSATCKTAQTGVVNTSVASAVTIPSTDAGTTGTVAVGTSGSLCTTGTLQLVTTGTGASTCTGLVANSNGTIKYNYPAKGSACTVVFNCKLDLASANKTVTITRQLCVPNATGISCTPTASNSTAGKQNCSSNGMTTTTCVVTACASGYYINTANNTCVAQACTPNAVVACTINNVSGTQKCNATGSAYGACAPTCTAKCSNYDLKGSDVNGSPIAFDCKINTLDFAEFRRVWNLTGNARLAIDFNTDGFVNTLDYSLFRQAFTNYNSPTKSCNP